MPRATERLAREVRTIEKERFPVARWLVARPVKDTFACVILRLCPVKPMKSDCSEGALCCALFYLLTHLVPVIDTVPSRKNK